MSNDDLGAGAVSTLIRPGDAEWDSARRFHSGIGSPAAIIRASSVDDVSDAVRYAAGQRLDVTIRGGGHGADVLGREGQELRDHVEAALAQRGADGAGIADVRLQNCHLG
ncbi:FAD-binding protein, partial [Microbacterium terrae]|uniref:FAD-binding protein n=1 Tax=Microbacterium terrae TaxID=69369 RepID=UPI0012ECD311